MLPQTRRSRSQKQQDTLTAFDCSHELDPQLASSARCSCWKVDADGSGTRMKWGPKFTSSCKTWEIIVTFQVASPPNET